MTQPSRAKPRRRFWGKPLLALGSALVGLLLAEGGVRLWMRVEGEPYSAQALLEKFERNANTLEAFTPKSPKTGNAIPESAILHPFYGSEYRPDTGGVLAYFSQSPRPRDFEVLLVGGSVAMLFGKHASADLTRTLSADPRLRGRGIRVLRGAHAAYKQPQQLNKVAYILAHSYRPDVVVNLDGFNEVAMGLQNAEINTHPLYPSTPAWGGLLAGRSRGNRAVLAARGKIEMLKEQYETTLARAKSTGILRSALGGSWVRHELKTLRSQQTAIQNEVLEFFSRKKSERRNSIDSEFHGSPFKNEELPVMKLSLRSWVECSISLNAICAARGIGYVHALQPTLCDVGAKPMTDKESNLNITEAWRRGVQLGYPAMRAAIPELEAAGVHFLDLSRTFENVRETLYFDACHFDERGSKMLVDDIARAVLSTLD